MIQFAKPDSTANPGLEFSPTRPDEPGARLTIFAMPKAFRGHIGMIQRNAIESWNRLTPRPEILLFGNDEGTAALASELGVVHVPDVERNEHGTPLMNGMFREAQRLARHDVLVYVNSDIVLFDDLPRAAHRAVKQGFDRFLMVGRRTDLDVSQPLDFSSSAWSRSLLTKAVASGSLAPRVCKDYFVFRKPLYAEIPPFAIGRAAFDNWLVYHARNEGAAVIDATKAVQAVHQNHDYAHMPGGRGQAYVKGIEARRNIELAGGMRLVKGSTTDWIMTPQKIRRRRVPSDFVQFASDLPKFLRLVSELYGLSSPLRRRTRFAGAK